jgi:hypothetical protein
MHSEDFRTGKGPAIVPLAQQYLSAEPVQEREGKMISSNGIKPVYDPDTLRIMADAFDRACRFLPVQFKNNERMRRKLALHIIRHLNEGESDPTRLADSAILFVRRY